jgi:phosphatidylserine/phosphatidylglycerophosphate/cardiolipin synthase-like enzyme
MKREITRALAVFGALILSVQAFAMELRLSNAPTDDLALTVSSISSAQKSIFLNIYELSSPNIADALIERISAGIPVVILEEGSPVGGLSTASKGIQNQLASAMGAAHARGCHLYVMSGSNRRFKFDHAKYAVIDDEWLLLGSENYSPSGNPVAGSLGNRGWEVMIHDAQTAQSFKTIFLSDSATTHGDVKEVTATGGVASAPLPTASSTGVGGVVTSADSVQMITSPNTSLSGLIGLIQNARSTIDIEQMTFDSHWTGSATTSPLVDALIAAANRGVKVRVLLNDEKVFMHTGQAVPVKNTTTIALLNTHAGILARTANLHAMGVDYIHNKGMLIDGTTTLISSINWDQNSIERNREAALALTSTQANAYYETLFNQDWSVSATAGTPTPTQSPAMLTSLGPLPPPAFVCPDQVTLTAQIGAINVTDQEDADMASLQNKQFSDVFKRTGASGCVFGAASTGTRVSDSLTLEVKKKSNGKWTVDLEGYTPNHQKPFSLQAVFQNSSDLMGDHSAILFDMGPSRERIGDGEIHVQF